MYNNPVMCEVYNTQTKQEDNPKQILIDWINDIYDLAKRGRDYTKVDSPYKDKVSREGRLDIASDYFSNILGQCTAIKSTLKNSN